MRILRACSVRRNLRTSNERKKTRRQVPSKTSDLSPSVPAVIVSPDAYVTGEIETNLVRLLSIPVVQPLSENRHVITRSDDFACITEVERISR